MDVTLSEMGFPTRLVIAPVTAVVAAVVANASAIVTFIVPCLTVVNEVAVVIRETVRSLSLHEMGACHTCKGIGNMAPHSKFPRSPLRDFGTPMQ